MQQSRALQAADAAGSLKRPGSAAMTLETLDASQKKMDVRITKMSRDMGHKLDGMMKMMTKLAESNNIRKNTETEEDMEYYTLDANGEPRRSSAESLGSKGSWNNDSGELSARGRSMTAETVSSTKATRSSFRPSIDGVTPSELGVVPEKSKSMSRIMSPVGIMRKKSSDGNSSKKRHSFSDPIATVKEFGLSPKGDNSGRGFGASSDGADRVQHGSIVLSEDDEDSVPSIDDAPSPETLPTRVPSLGRMFVPKISPRTRGESPRDPFSGSGPPKNASPRVVPLNVPLAEHAHSQSAEELSLRLKKQQLSASNEESKVPLGDGDEDVLLLLHQASSRTIESDSSTIHGTPQHSPTHARAYSPVNELNQQQREINRQKPTPPLKELSPHSHSNFTPIKKSAVAAADRSPISGPPVELALSAINQSRIDKTRAQSAGRAYRGL